MSRFQAGVIGIVVVALLAYGAYTKFANPFASKFTVHALFSSANGLGPDSLVRIAGVNVGRVTAVSTVPGCKLGGDADVAVPGGERDDGDRSPGSPAPPGRDVRDPPRIFLEGNFFVDVDPGSPSAPTIKTGHTFPITQGTEPVQLDQVLDSLGRTRGRTCSCCSRGTAPRVSKGGSAYNASIKYWLPAYEYSAIVAHDALGLQPHDLSNWISAQGTVAGALNAHPQELESLITDFNTTANAFARAERGAVRTRSASCRTRSPLRPRRSTR